MDNSTQGYQILRDGSDESDDLARVKNILSEYVKDSILDVQLNYSLPIKKILKGKKYLAAVGEFEIFILNTEFQIAKTKKDSNILRSGISSDDKFLAYSIDNTMHILDLENPSHTTFDLSFGNVFELVFSKHHLITAHYTRPQPNSPSQTKLAYWNMHDFTIEKVFDQPGSPDTVGSIAVNKDNTRLFTAGSSKEIKVWKYFTSEIEFTFSEAHLDSILGLTISESQKYLVSCSLDQMFKVWSLEDYTLINIGSGHTAKVFQTVFTPDEKMLFVASCDCYVLIWDTQTWELIDKVYSNVTKEITGILEFQGDIVLITANGIRRIKLSNTPKFTTYLESPSPIECFIPNSDNSKILYVASDQLYSKELNNESLSIANKVKAVGYLESPNIIVVGLDNGNLRVYTSDTNEHFEIDSEAIGNTRIRCIALYEDDKILRAITAGINHQVYRWNLKKSKIDPNDSRCEVMYDHSETNDTNFQISTVIYYTVGEDRHCITRDTYGNVVVFSISKWMKLACISTYPNLSKYARCMVLSSKQLILTGNENGIISLHTLSGILKGELKQKFSVEDLAVTKDGNYLLSLHSPNSLSHSIIKVWSLEEQVDLITIPLPIICTRIHVSDSGFITVGSDHRIISLPNILDTQAKISIYPFENSYIFASKTQELLKSRGDMYLPQFNEHIIFPHKINMSYIYALNNSSNALNDSLRDNGKFIKNLRGETPLSYALRIRSRECVGSILRQAPKFRNDMQPQIYELIEEHIFKINCFQTSGLSTFYQNCLKTVKQQDLPTSGELKSYSPVVHLASDKEIQSSNFLLKSEQNIEQHQQLTFQVMRFKLNFTEGSQESLTFLKSLLNITDPEILSTPAISAIVHYKWKFARKVISIFAILDLLFLICYTLHVNIYREEIIPVILLVIFNTLFFIAELIQVIRDISNLSDYISDFWNMNDLIRIIAFYIYTMWFFQDNQVLDNHPWIGFVVTIVAWIRMFAYFRLLDSTRYLINMLFEIVKDMLPFFAILISANVAFGLLMHQLNPDTLILDALKVTYKIAYQDFETNSYDNTEWIWFLIISIINALIMLNLLIAIMGDTYDRVKERQNVADIQELLNMILETESYLIWKKQATDKSYLQLCFGSDEQSRENSQDWQGKIKAISSQVKNVQTSIETLNLNLETLNKNLTKHLKEDQDAKFNKLRSYIDHKFTELRDTTLSRSL